jgi:acyl-CoA synthetase (AMP-forming)/AMP-acid ligase II/acyl carrier protein
MMKTLPEIFRQHATSQKVCLRLHGAEAAAAPVKELTHPQLHAALVNKSQVFSTRFGLRKGATIALVADNSLDYLITVYSALFAGLTVFVISTKTLPDHLAYFLQRSQTTLLLCSAEHGQLCHDAASKTGLRVADLSAFALTTADLQADPALVEQVHRAGPVDTDTAIILHTSGTTRTPKLVYLSHRNILANQMASDGAYGKHWGGDTVDLAWLPLFHGYALLAQFLRDMITGGTYVLFLKTGQVTADALLDAIRQTGANGMCCVPWMLNLIREKIAAEEESGDSAALQTMQQLQFIVTGGSNLGETLGAFFRERAVRIVTMFGLSECSGFVLHSPFDGSAWDEMLPNAKSGVELVPVEEGAREHELIITRADLFSGKVLYPPGEADLHAGRTRLETGDLFLRKGGGWTYLGRGDQIYNGAHGEKVNPLLFELGLEALVGVERAFVFGEEMSFNVALVKLKPGLATDSAFIAKMKTHIQDKVNPGLENPDRVYPGDVYVLGDNEAMPLTPKGSVNRKEAAKVLKARIAARADAAVEGVADAATVSAIFHEELAAYYKAGAEGGSIEDSTLLELGFDSLMTLSLRNNLQDKLKLKIPIELMLAYPPLRDFENALIALNDEAKAGGGSRAAQRNMDPDGWRPIALEQVTFHRAYYLFPGPTFGGSFSLVASRHLSADEVRRGLRFVERNHEVLKSIYKPDGNFRIADYSMVERAFIGHFEMRGDHDLNNNLPMQELIQNNFALQPYNFDEGASWRYATVDITNDANETVTMIFIGINHVIGDFRTFSLMVQEFMRYLDGTISEADVVPDDFRGVLVSATPERIQKLQQLMQTILTTGLDQLPKGVDVRKGARLRFNFRDIDMTALTNAFRTHNVSVFNGVYAAWVVAASRHIEGLALEDFPAITSVTTRITKELEKVMGCFVFTPVYRFSLRQDDTMKAAAAKVSDVMLNAFKGVLIDPVAFYEKVVADPRNLMPITKRNIVLYRSPDELIDPVPGWGCYRNDYFEDRCNVGAYFDFCANKADNSMEGYLTVNLLFCSPETARKVLDEIELLMRLVLANPALDFKPAEVLAKAAN